MVEQILDGVIGVFSTGDMIQLGIMLVVMVLAGLTMPNFGSIITTTVLALVLFAVAVYVRAVAMEGADAAQLAETTWNSFLALSVETLFTYAVAFAAVITVIFVLRSVVSREG